MKKREIIIIAIVSVVAVFLILYFLTNGFELPVCGYCNKDIF